VANLTRVVVGWHSR